ncbi:hypothetical protein BC829DRAFT_429960 [Chytridium lagenaria]|nr:hypothetical protein BC829DRAFT_429960 [Chytridium lagenaria]
MRSEQWKKRPVPRRLDPLDASLPNLPTVLEDSTEITTFSEPSPLSPSQTPLIHTTTSYPLTHPRPHILHPHQQPSLQLHTPMSPRTRLDVPHLRPSRP